MVGMVVNDCVERIWGAVRGVQKRSALMISFGYVRNATEGRASYAQPGEWHRRCALQGRPVDMLRDQRN